MTICRAGGLHCSLGAFHLLATLFGETKGSGAAMLFFVIGITGVLVCLIFNFILRKYKWSENAASMDTQ